uniref:Neuregulin 4 n=1 Tax=Equus asinus TaxID=9793 RepID=A0A9L0J135_EQUAS
RAGGCGGAARLSRKRRPWRAGLVAGAGQGAGSRPPPGPERSAPASWCGCVENYTGARCEEIFLPSFSIRTKSDLFAAFVALAILLGTFIIGAIYFLCRNGHLQRANVVQYDINLVETNSTSAHHSHGEH